MNVLANRALASAGTRTRNYSSSGNVTLPPAAAAAVDDDDDSNQYHLHEVLSVLPDLQHGMDVNPKFTAGPTGVEYTNNLAAFDLLGVQLVHGWLLDPQDEETASVVHSKTYNELIETVIYGSDAREALQRTKEKLRELEAMLEEKICAGMMSPPCDDDRNHAHAGEVRIVGDGMDESGKFNASINQSNAFSTEDSIASLQNEIIDTKDKISELSFRITQSEVANAFLTSSGHQLTYHGLEQLHNHVGEDHLCVFFRNNHFSTLTKHGGILHLLVSDLGYTNTPEIVWEKLDNIDGDTEYCNEFFEKPTPRTELKPGPGPTIAPELILAQRSQAESDFQLALALSKGESSVANPPTRTNDDSQTRMHNDDEIKLIEEAKRQSLESYHHESDNDVEFIHDDDSRASTPDTKNEWINIDKNVSRITEQERSEHESEQLARQLQELEYERGERLAATANPRRQAGATAPSPGAKRRQGPASSSCAVS